MTLSLRGCGQGMLFTITFLISTPDRPSAQFWRIRAVSGTFPHPHPGKTPLMISAYLHGYALK